MSKPLTQHLHQNPRPETRFERDVDEAVEHANLCALQHSGHDNVRYARFLVAVAERLKLFAEDV